MYFIYVITCLINNKQYVGKTNNVEARLAQHFYKAKTGSILLPKLYPAIRKHGENNFTITIIDKFENEIESYLAEEKYIKIYDTFNKGYNSTIGGGSPGNYWLGKHRSVETKSKISESHIGLRHSESTIEKLSNSHMGDKNPKTAISDNDVRTILILWFEQPEEERKKYGAKSKFYKNNIEDKYPIKENSIYDILNRKSRKTI